MAGNRIGGLKAAQKNLNNNPNFYKEIGKKGGSVTGVKKGFAANPQLARLAGSIGGTRSKRSKAVKNASTSN